MSNTQYSFEPIWEIGVYDAHCHPTDIMDSVGHIPAMKAKVLTVMSTRAQDQELVEQTAARFAIRKRSDLNFDSDTKEDDLSSDNSSEATHFNTKDIAQARYKDGDAEHKVSTKKMIPAFGWHPWFSHQIFDDRKDGQNLDNFDADAHYQAVLTPVPDDAFLKTLQKPIPLSAFLQETENRLEKFPLALIGEVGLDRSFRLPEGPSSMTGNVSMKTGGDDGAYTPGSREGRPLTPYKVSLDQQKMVLKTQLELAAKHNRPVSVHSVQAHGVVFEVLQSLWKGHQRLSKRQQKKRKDIADAFTTTDPQITEDEIIGPPQTFPYPPRVCMHSFSGPPETLKLFIDPKIPSDMFISFSECINFNSPSWKKAAEVIKAVPEDKILVESDLHCAGHEMDKLLESIVRRVCEIKGWTLQEGAQILKKNWMRFIFGE